MPRSRLIVELADRPSYTVRIGDGLLSELGASLQSVGSGATRCLVVADALGAAHLPTVEASLAAAGCSCAKLSLDAPAAPDAWECLGELFGAFDAAKLAKGDPVVVVAGTAVSELVSFAVKSYGPQPPLVLVPCSHAAALRTLATDRIEADLGFAHPLSARCEPALALCDTQLLATADSAEREESRFELEQAALFGDADFQSWLAGELEHVLAGEADAATLALTQVLADRANALGAALERAKG